MTGLMNINMNNRFHKAPQKPFAFVAVWFKSHAKKNIDSFLSVKTI